MITTGEWLTIIAAGGAALVAVINAIAAGWGRAALIRSVKDSTKAAVDSAVADGAVATNQKLDHITVLTNSNLTEVTARLERALTRIDALESLLRKYGRDQHATARPPTLEHE